MPVTIPTSSLPVVLCFVPALFSLLLLLSANVSASGAAESGSLSLLLSWYTLGRLLLALSTAGLTCIEKQSHSHSHLQAI